MPQQNGTDQVAPETKTRQEALLAEYSEVCNNFRMLTDIRFKLLAFLPIAAGVAAALAKENLEGIGLPLSLFGLVVTIGIVTYNARNDQLYDELVDRAAAIERSLNIPDGAFANRPTAWLRIRFLGMTWNIDHRRALSTIYAASIALWLFGVVAHVLGVVNEKILPAWRVDLIAVAAAIIVTYLGGRSIRRQRKVREKVMSCLAARAVRKAVRRPVPQVARDPEVIEICAKLSDSTEDKVSARAGFYATADPEWARYYVPQDSQELSACQLIALLTDLSPLWIFDCYTNRKGSLREDWPVNIVYRGGGGIGPENTLVAFRAAAEAGARGLKLDVHMTRDEEIVVIHDATVDRTTNGSGAVADMTLNELRSLNAGYRFSLDGGRTYPYRSQGLSVPTLGEVYEEFPDTLMNIEIKAAQQGVEKALQKVVRATDAEERTLVVSSHHAVMRRFRKVSMGRVSTGASRLEIGAFYVLSRLRLESLACPAYKALQVPVEYEGIRLVTSRFVKAAHSLRVRVDVWTINDPAEMCRLLDIGLDVIMTDRPDVLAGLLPEGK